METIADVDYGHMKGTNRKRKETDLSEEQHATEEPEQPPPIRTMGRTRIKLLADKTLLYTLQLEMFERNVGTWRNDRSVQGIL